MIRRILGVFGYKIVYECEWGSYSQRYDASDAYFGRHIHKNMTVAPPWAKSKIVKK